MIKRLRRKFILINLLLVGLVLAVVFILFVGANARRLAGQSDAALRLALSWQDGEGPPRFEIGGPPPEEHEPDGAHRFSLIPVFVVTVKDGAIASLNDGGQVDVSEETAAEAVKQAQSSGASQGVLRELRLRFLVERRPDGELRIAFADLGWETASLRNLSLLSLLVWALAMVGLFFVSLVLSSVALRPAERAWQQQRQFVADASHELKTPLTVILANTGLVLSHPEDTVAAQSKWLEYTHDEAEQMKGLVDDLLFLAKSDAARQPAARAETAISEVALGCLLPFESVAFESGVALEHRITLGLSLRGDEGQLRRLVMILLDNAVKYAGPGGTVTSPWSGTRSGCGWRYTTPASPSRRSTSPTSSSASTGRTPPGTGAGAATAWGWPLPGASWRATTGGSPSPAPPRPAPPSPPCSPAGDGFACQDGAAVVKWACSRRSWKGETNSCPLL